MVLAQALACGLPLLATENCGAPDFVREGETGWIVPIRSPDRLAERLRWCGEHRNELAEMVQPGRTTKELDEAAAESIRAHGGKSPFYHYRHASVPTPYPGHMCISINDEVVHGLPGKRRIQYGGSTFPNEEHETRDPRRSRGENRFSMKDAENS